MIRRKTVLILVTFMISAVFALTGCTRPFFNVTQNEDQTISITAEKAPADSAGISYITAGENEILLAETDFEEKGEIQLRIFKGTLGEETFPDKPERTKNISGTGSFKIPLEPGEYTIDVKVLSKITGTAVLRMIPDSSTAADSQESPDHAAFETIYDYIDWGNEKGYTGGYLEPQGLDGINQDYFHTPPNSASYTSGKIVIGDSRCCQMGIYEVRTDRSDFATFAVWGGHYVKGNNPPILTEEHLSDIVACFQEQIRTCGKSEVIFFATVNDYDYIDNNNQANIQAAVDAAEQIASMSYKYNGTDYHPQVSVIGFDGGDTERDILSRVSPEEFNRYYEEFNKNLRSAVQKSEILKEKAPDYTTVPEIVGGKASFITDALHYSDETLETIIRYIRNL